MSVGCELGLSLFVLGRHFRLLREEQNGKLTESDYFASIDRNTLKGES